MTPETASGDTGHNPAAVLLRRAGVWHIAAGLLWPVQAAGIAWIIAGWVGEDGASTFAPALALVVLAGLGRALATRTAEALSFTAADTTMAAARARLLSREARLLRADLSSAEIAATLTDKIAHLGPALQRYRPAMLRVRVLPLVYLAIILPMSWAAALILAVAGPLIPVFMALIGMAAKEASARQMTELGDMNRMLIDRVSALPDLRLLDATGRARDGFADAADRLRDRTMAVLRVAFLSSTVLELFAALGVAMLAVYVGFSLLGEIGFGAWATPLTVFEGILILLLAPEFFQPLRDLAAAWHDKAAADAVDEELAALEAGPPPILGHGTVAEALPGAAVLQVHQAVVRRADRRLRLPDLTLRPGEGLALTGPSGVGKSTFIDVVTGLLPLEQGAVTVCGVPLGDATADAWRARIAVVPQAVRVPDTTLRDFLDPTGSGRDPQGALAQAHASGLVAALPNGLETRLGETGAGVSGGEMRRLLLARALLAAPDLLIADEPTADLDAATAAQVTQTLRSAMASGLAVLVATHDSSLAGAMTRVVRLDPACEQAA